MRWPIPLLAAALLITGCGGSDAKSRTTSTSGDRIAEEIAENTEVPEEEAGRMLQALDGDVKPEALPRGWVPGGRDGFWVGPAEHSFARNVNVTSFPAEDGVSPEDYMLQSKGKLDELSSEPVKILAEEQGTFLDREGELLEYQLAYDGKQVRGRQYYVQSGDRIYVITGTGLAADWDEQGSEIRKVMASFDLG